MTCCRCVQKVDRGTHIAFSSRRPLVVTDSRQRSFEEGPMKARFIVLVLMLVGVLGVGAIATRGDNVNADRQWTLINFVDPTMVAGEILMGPFLVVHDSQKMAHGEPCSTFYRFDKK